jgi:hypothetical protein
MGMIPVYRDAFLTATVGTSFEFVSLHTGDPGEDGANEVTSGDYERQNPQFGTASGGMISNDTKVEFPTLTESWGTITHIGFWTQDGEDPPFFLAGYAVNAPRTPEVGQKVVIGVGALQYTFTG